MLFERVATVMMLAAPLIGSIISIKAFHLIHERNNGDRMLSRTKSKLSDSTQLETHECNS